MSRRRFSEEYKQEAVKLVLDQGVSIKDAALDLGLGASTIDKWVRERRAGWGTPKALTPEDREELKRLRKENRKLRLERDLLKKATAYFAKDTSSDVSS